MTLRDQLREFHEKFDHYRSDGPPAVPPEAVVRLRARLIIEEACEALEAIFSGRFESGQIYKKALLDLCDILPVQLDLPALADALGDIDYVVEGARASFGIDGEPIADAIHAANMAKGKKDKHGKTTKPRGWKPPDIAGELRRQGWTPPSSDGVLGPEFNDVSEDELARAPMVACYTPDDHVVIVKNKCGRHGRMTRSEFGAEISRVPREDTPNIVLVKPNGTRVVVQR